MAEPEDVDVIKVVYCDTHADEPKRISTSAGGILEVEYKEGQWSKGFQGTPLLALPAGIESHRALDLVATQNGAFEVWQAKARHARPAPAALDIDHAMLHPEIISQFWQDTLGLTPEQARSIGWAHAFGTPPGTLACDEIMLVERLWP